MKKIAEESSGIGGWIGEHPLATAGIGAGLGAGSLLAKRSLFPKAPIGPVNAKIRRLAQSGGLHIAVPQSAAPVEYKGPFGVLHRMGRKILSPFQSVKSKMESGFLPSITTNEAGRIVGGTKRKGVSLGGVIDPRFKSEAEIMTGGMRPGSKQYKQVMNVMDKLEREGKAMEAGKELGLSRFFGKTTRGTSIHTKYKIKPPRAGASVEERMAYLDAMRNAIAKEHGKAGFFLKPHGLAQSGGAFPAERDKWGRMYKNYLDKLKPRMDAYRKKVLSNPEKYNPLGEDVEALIAQKYRDNPLYRGRSLESLVGDPRRAVAQSKLPVVTDYKGNVPEYRVHVIGGEVPTELATDRYNFTRAALARLPLVEKIQRRLPAGSSTEAAEWVRKHVVPRLKGKYRQGTYGMDVIRVKKPDGSYGFKLVELNPTSRIGGGSGFLDPSLNAAAPYDVYKYVYGKDHPLIAAAKAGGAGLAGGAGGLGASALARRRQRKSEG